MPSPLTIDEFKLVSITTELRYKNAFLIYDRTGRVLKDLHDSFTDINVSSASPQQTAFTAEEGSFVLELGACRFTSGQTDAETFAKHSTAFFNVVVDHLEIEVFTRIGLRCILRKEFKAEEESRAALASLRLPNLEPIKRFNSSDSPTEVMFRWEDTQIGATVRLKAETAEIKVTASPELRESLPKVDKKIIGLTLDTDYYTAAPVEREQWNSQEWLPQKLRIIRKELNGILQGGGR